MAGFRSLIVQLAEKVCDLHSIPPDTFGWSLERQILWIIENCQCSGGGNGVSDLNYDPATQVLTVKYNDGRPQEVFKLQDYYLDEVDVDVPNKTIEFKLNNTVEMDADLTPLFVDYYNIDEVNSIAANTSIQWNNF